LLDPGLIILRQRLKQLNVWPDAGDQFLEMMPHFLWHAPPLTETDAQWLPQVVDDATKGVDIGAAYPAFFQKLLSSEPLRQSFLSALDNKCNTA
jgi:hypothetical protein